MTTSHVCPKGHVSAESDYCDTCGSPIGGAPTQVLPAQVVETSVRSVAVNCPVCGATQADGDRFCENDGFDFVTGRRPATSPDQPVVAVPPPTATKSAWTVRVEADRAHYDRVGAEEVEFPAVCPPRDFVLEGSEIRIGRRSASRGIAPEIDLTGPPLDPGISHLHAVLTSTATGWTLTDPGSANGTTLNGSDAPIATGVPVPLADGDRIHLGAWTTLTISAQ